MLMMMKNGGMDAHQVDIDSEFEPHARSRSCTWPLPCPEDFSTGEEASRGLALAAVKVEPYNVPACRADRKGGAPAEIKHPAGAPAPIVAAAACMSGAALDVAGQLRKAKSSRRNAWGNLSYADLITRAIESAPEKRLTLSQIYDWMVRFVPYFKDKGDSNSSAGWKVRPRERFLTAPRSSCSIFRLRLRPQTRCIFPSHIIDPWPRQFMSAVRPRVTPRYSMWEGAVGMFGSGFAEFIALWDCSPRRAGTGSFRASIWRDDHYAPP